MADIGIVLSGGILKGAYQIGALKYISEIIDISHIKYISGASIGALNGFAYATDNIDIAVDDWMALDSIHDLSIVSVLKGKYIDGLINNMCGCKIETNTDVIVPLFNISEMRLEYICLSKIDQSILSKYLKASISLPPFKNGIIINDKKYIDGAVVDNIPIGPIKNKKLDYIICIYFDKLDYVFENTEFDSKIIRINPNYSSFIKKSLFIKQADINGMLYEGYKDCYIKLCDLFKNGVDDIEYILNINNKMISKNKSDKNKIYITGDMIVDNINKALSKVVNRQSF